MRTLDRYIVRNFAYIAMMCFIVMMSLRIIVDLFVNFDEFAKQDKAFLQLAAETLTYYAYSATAYFVELGGMIVVASAAFTLAMMNHSNELTAMMASGVSLRRVAMPIIICSLILGGLIVLDQELVIPQVADKLVRNRDDVTGSDAFHLRLATDGQRSIWWSPSVRAREQLMTSPAIFVRDPQLRLEACISGEDARPWRLDNKTKGWVVNGGTITPGGEMSGWRHAPSGTAVWTTIGPKRLDQIAQDAMVQQYGQAAALQSARAIDNVQVRDDDYRMTLAAKRFEPDAAGTGWSGGKLLEPRFTFDSPSGQTIGVFFASSAQWEQRDGAEEGCWKLTDGGLFYPTDLTTQDLALRQSSRWLDYMSMSQLSDLLRLQRLPNPDAAMLVKQVRVTEPLNNLVMLMLGLPFILSRERNIKASAGLCLLTVATFYVIVYICRYMGLPPMLGAWLPSILFLPVAIVMFDSVKT